MDISVAELSGILKHCTLKMAQQHDVPWDKNTFGSYTTNHKTAYICIIVLRNFGMVFISVSPVSHPLSN
jgi:hypothetical protein